MNEPQAFTMDFDDPVTNRRIEAVLADYLPDAEVRDAVRRAVPAMDVSPDEPRYRDNLRRLTESLRLIDQTADPIAYLAVVELWHLLICGTGDAPLAEFARLFGRVSRD